MTAPEPTATPSLELVTEDLAAVRRFYLELLGWEDLGAGRVATEGLELRWREGRPPGRALHGFEVEVGSLEELLAEAARRGIPTLRRWREGGSPRALLADPEGNLLELVEVSGP